MKKFCFFSEVHGMIAINDIPLPGVSVVRKYKSSWFHEEEQEEETATDADGNFYFPPAYARISLLSLIGSYFSHEITIEQNIIAYYEDNNYECWFCTKSNYDENGELSGKLLNLFCDLTKTPERKDGYYGIGELV